MRFGAAHPAPGLRAGDGGAGARHPSRKLVQGEVLPSCLLTPPGSPGGPCRSPRGVTRGGPRKARYLLHPPPSRCSLQFRSPPPPFSPRPPASAPPPPCRLP